MATKEGVTKLLRGLNLSKTLGPDELHRRILKELAMKLSPIFAHLFHQSINTGEIPKNGPLQMFVPCVRRSTGILLALTALFLLHAFLVGFLNIVYPQISWLILMNMSSCRTTNMHLEDGIAVKLS